MIPQHSAPRSPAGPPGSRPRRDGILVAVAALLGAVVVLGGLVGFQLFRSGDADEVVAADGNRSSSQTTEPAEDTEAGGADSDQEDAEPEPLEDQGEGDLVPGEAAPPGEPVETVPCPQEYSDVICDAAEFVQQARGRPFKEFPVIELLENDQFDEDLLEGFEESRADLEEDEKLLKALGLIEADLDLFTTFESLLEVGVVGFYDPEDGRLVVRGGDFDLYGQSILVHELVHAFDDQWFDLNRDDFENDDAEYGFLAVVEGNASYVEEQWRLGLNDRDLALLREQELGSIAPEDLDRLLSLPEILLELQSSPYLDGERYVADLIEDGGAELVDERLADPPETSEEVLHPNSRPDLLSTPRLERPDVDGSVLHEDRLGEIIIRLWLGERAATGWGNDVSVTWESGGQTCTTVDIATDSEQDQEELEQAAGQWVQGDEDLRTVETVQGAAGPLVRVTGCF